MPLPAALAIQSANGRAKLEIPADALPFGVSLKDIHITELTGDSAPRTVAGTPPLAAYRLEPDGLRFRTPVTVTIMISVSVPNAPLPLLLNLAGDEVEPLRDTNVEFDRQSGRLEVGGTVSHFSTVLVHRGFFRVSLDDLTDHAVGETFGVAADIERTGDVNTLVPAEQFRGIDRIESRVTTDEPWRLSGYYHTPPYDVLSRAEPVLNPKGQIFGHPTLRWVPADSNSWTTIQSFTCVRAGNYYISYGGSLEYSEINEFFQQGERRNSTHWPTRGDFYLRGGPARCVETAQAADSPPPGSTPTNASPPTNTPPPTRPPLQDTPAATPTRAAACTLGVTLALDEVVVVPGQYHEGVIRIRAFDRSGSRPMAGVRFELEARKSDGQVTQGTVTTNEQGEATARMRTTDYGQNTLTVSRVTSSACPWPSGEVLPRLTWEARP